MPSGRCCRFASATWLAAPGTSCLAAARRLGKELARVRTGEDEPAPERVREAIRDVVTHCIYGVDKNPLAVELCRVALWLETPHGGQTADVPGPPHPLRRFAGRRFRPGGAGAGHS